MENRKDYKGIFYVKDCAKSIVLATEKYNKLDPLNIDASN